MADKDISRRQLLRLGLTGLVGASGLGGGLISPSLQAGWGGGLKTRKLGNREYLLQLPAGHRRRDGKLPVLLLFHGGGGKARGFARYSGFMERCDALGFIGVYPQGVDGHWYDARYRSVHPAPAGVDDVAFVGQLLDKLAKNPLADMDRVYAMGMSNGGIFCQQLGLQMSGRLAAIASVCGQLPAPLAAGFKPTTPLSVLLMNGTEDPIVPYAGGEVGMIRRWGPKKGQKRATGRVISTDRNMRLWVRHNQLPAHATITELPNRAPGDGCQAYRQRWGRPRGGVGVELYRIQGGGHTIPGRKQYMPKKLIGRACQDLDGTAVIWEFFQRHRLGA